MNSREVPPEGSRPVPRKLMEDKNFQSLMSCLNIGLFVSDPLFHKLISFSSNLADILEIDPLQLKNYPARWGDILRSEEGGRIDEILLTALDRGEKVDFDLTICDELTQHRKRIRITLLDCSLRQTHEVFGQIQDITELREKEIALAKMQSFEVEISARIQKKLLLGAPRSLPEGLVIAATSIPSQHVDGDFYEFNRLSPHTVDFFVGDVMGKGLNASLLGAGAKNLFQKNLISLITGKRDLPALRDIVDLADSYLTKDLIQYNSFITLNYSRVDREKGFYHFVDCGHNPLIHYSKRENSCWIISGKNMPLGFKDHQNFKESVIPMEEGDLFFLHSDGITETKNEREELFGLERLIHILTGYYELEPKQLVEKVIRLSFNYSYSGFEDDATALAVKIGTILEEKNLRSYPLSLHRLTEKNDWSEVFSLLERDLSLLCGPEKADTATQSLRDWLLWLKDFAESDSLPKEEESHLEELSMIEEDIRLGDGEKVEWFTSGQILYFSLVYRGVSIKSGLKEKGHPFQEIQLAQGLRDNRKILGKFSW